MSDNEPKYGRRELIAAAIVTALGAPGAVFLANKRKSNLQEAPLSQETPVPPPRTTPESTKLPTSIPTKAATPAPTDTPIEMPIIDISELNKSPLLTPSVTSTAVSTPSTTPLVEMPVADISELGDNSSPITHESLPWRAALQATATAVSEGRLLNSFVEKEGFTKEIFRNVQESTFIIDLPYKQGAETRYTQSTAWLAHKSGTEFYFVLNKHAFAADRQYQGVAMGRPGIDEEMLTSRNFKYVLSPTHDLALIKVLGNFNVSTPLTPLSWQDDFQPSAPEPVMTVGFPELFKRSKDPIDFVTAGQVGTTVNMGNAQKTEWVITTTAGPGSSGSPAVILKDKKPVVVGCVFANSDSMVDLPIGKNEIQRQNPTLVTSLQVRQLIEAMNKA